MKIFVSATTWTTSFNALEQEAKLLLQMLAWFAPDPIPEFLLDTPIVDEAGIADTTARLFHHLGQLFLNRAEYSEAEQLLRRALAIDEASYGADHPSVAIRLNNLAHLLQSTNRLSEAEPLMRRSLGILETGYGSENPNTVMVRNNLDILLKLMG